MKEIVLEKELLITNAEVFCKTLKESIADYKEFIIDASALQDIDATGIQLLISLKKECLEKNSSLKFKEEYKVIKDFAESIGLNFNELTC